MPNRCSLALALLAALLPATGFAEPLRYSGSLMDAGVPAEGAYGLRMALYDARKGGHRIGREITLADVAVKDGGFATQADFGLPLLTLQTAWLQVEVASSDGRFEALGAREALDPKFMKAGVCWDTAGNAGTDPASSFLGTIDNRTLNVRVNSVRALSIVPTAGSPNLILGSLSNTIATSAVGVNIAGGGEDIALGRHRINDNYGVIGGGRGNVVGDNVSSTDETDGTIAGGSHNQTRQSGATVGGGSGNYAFGVFSTTGGGEDNQATAPYATVSGGMRNDIDGSHGTIPGGQFNLAGGDNSLAAGSYAHVRPQQLAYGIAGSGDANGDEGTFVWADTPPPPAMTRFASTGPNQFLVRARAGVGINMNTPASSLHVRHELYDPEGPLIATPDPGSVITAERDAGNVFISIIGAPTSQRGILFGEPGSVANGAITYDSGGSSAMEFRTNGNVTRMRIDADGTVRNTTGAWSTLSDARVKRNIEPIRAPLATLLALRGHRFEYTDKAPQMGQDQRLGFIAQEVREAIPQWVREGSDGYLSVTPTGFEALTVEAMRELADENVALQSDNAALQAANTELRDAQAAMGKRLARIEAQLSQRTR